MILKIGKMMKIFLVVFLIFSVFSYSQIINLQSELGKQYSHSIRIMGSSLRRTIESLEKDNTCEIEINRYLEGTRIAFLSASISDTTFIDYNEKVISNYDLNRVITDLEYRKEFTQRLNALNNALSLVIEDMEAYKDNHIRATKIPHAFSLQPNPNKAYYDYFFRRPDRSSIQYRLKFHELLDKTFNRELDKLQLSTQ